MYHVVFWYMDTFHNMHLRAEIISSQHTHTHFLKCSESYSVQLLSIVTLLCNNTTEHLAPI